MSGTKQKLSAPLQKLCREELKWEGCRQHQELGREQDRVLAREQDRVLAKEQGRVLTREQDRVLAREQDRVLAREQEDSNPKGLQGGLGRGPGGSKDLYVK